MHSNIAQSKYQHNYTKIAYQQKCAYHPKQNITNFCKCEQCLLPVCPTCIKIHSDQHKQNKTIPHFQQLNKVINEINQTYVKLLSISQDIKQFLFKIQKQRKSEELQMRKQLVNKRNLLIKSFQGYLIQIQNDIMRQIVKYDEQFIKNMSQMEDQLIKIEEAINKQRENIHSQDLLKHIIVFYTYNNHLKYHKQLENIKNRGLAFTNQYMSVKIDEDQLNVMKKVIKMYMKLQIQAGNL